MLWIPFVLVLIATVCDLRDRTVPDWISVLLVCWAVLCAVLHLDDVSLWSRLGGMGLGLGVTIVVFALGGLGAGDVKLATALGAALGHAAFLGLLLCVALAGGLLALVAVLRGKRDLAYVPAFALGFVIFLAWKGGLNHVFASALAL